MVVSMMESLVIFGHTETEEVTYRSPDDTKTSNAIPGEIYANCQSKASINMDTGLWFNGQKLSALVN